MRMTVLVAEVEGELVAGLDAAAEAEVVRQAEDAARRLAGEVGGAVGGAIVGDQYAQVGVELAHLGDDAERWRLLRCRPG